MLFRFQKAQCLLEKTEFPKFARPVLESWGIIRIEMIENDCPKLTTEIPIYICLAI